MKQEESDTKIEEKKIETPCKYFNSIKGCRRGKKCWFNHDPSHEENKKTQLQPKPTKKFKIDPNNDKESNQEHGANLNKVILGLVKMLLRKMDI